MDEIIKLTDYQHHRLRNEMYFGSRVLHNQEIIVYDTEYVAHLKEIGWVPAIWTAFREIIDNALDELIGHGHGDKLSVTYNEKTRCMSVEDNGRGIPIDWDEENKCHTASMVIINSRAGRNFKERGQVVGTNGIGSSVVASCSEYLLLTVYRNNKQFYQKFTEGTPFLGDSLQIYTPEITKKYNKVGTKVDFRLSSEVFQDTTLPIEFVKSRLIEIAASNLDLKVYFNGELIKLKNKLEHTFFKIEAIPLEITEGTFNSKFWIIPNWTKGPEHFHSIVNNIPTLNGGVHVESFKKSFFYNMLNALEKESKKRKLTPNRSDIQDGVLVFNIIKMLAPNFDSQSKTRLINEDVGKIITKSIENEELYKEIIKKHKTWIEDIYKRCEERTHKKDQAELIKLAKKTAKAKVPSLMDATGTDRETCILTIAEGFSAIGGLTSARNPDIHGGIGLKGKIMNISGRPPKDVLENQVLKDIMNSIGLVIGEKADRRNLRYGQIYIAVDMDEDGKNICALLVNFFYTYWPELFNEDPMRNPFVNVFMTPFIIASKGKVRKYWYAHNYHDFDSEKYKGYDITRAKGLGSLTEEDWKYSLSNPVLVPLIDDTNLKESLDLIFNESRSNDRKKWIAL